MNFGQSDIKVIGDAHQFAKKRSHRGVPDLWQGTGVAQLPEAFRQVYQAPAVTLSSLNSRDEGFARRTCADEAQMGRSYVRRCG
jgi:hypothetical protein